MIESSSGWNRYNPLAPLLALMSHRALICRLVRRELEGRYKGSIFGVLWLVINPLLMLAVYTFVFSIVFSAKWGVGHESPGLFALIIFSGLIVFNVFAEPVGRSPTLVLENVSYVKKVVFPLEILTWVAIGGALFSAGISFVILLLFYLVLVGVPTFSIVLFPLVLLPVVFSAAGVSWFLSSLGVYFRDVKPIVGVLLTILMFLSPIFYPASAVPEGSRSYLNLNPLGLALESSKAILFQIGELNLMAWVIYLTISLVVAWMGYLWFSKTRKGFADVL